MAFEQGPHLERVKRNDNQRWPILALALGAVIIALAALHPWAEEGPRDDQAVPSAPVTVANASGTLSAATFDPNRLFAQCFPATGWRLASLQQQTQYKVRNAWPVSGGPLPSTTPKSAPTLYGPGVEAIGFCTPGTDQLTRSQYVADVSLWRRTAASAMALVADAGVLDPALAAQGEVYLTPPASISTDGTWPPGDYFFQVRPRGSAPGSNVATSRWLAMRLVVDDRSNAPTRTATPLSAPSFMHRE